MLKNISIDKESPTPKYLQIVEIISRLVKERILERGSRLPTINDLSRELGVSRVTVVNAYDQLRERRIIDATQGKGFYVLNTSVAELKRVFVLFDAMNGYKEVLYRSLVHSLGSKYNMSIYFFYYNYNEFCRLIEGSLGHYDHYLILPHFNFDVSRPLLRIPRKKLLLLDNNVESLKEGYAAVFQNFHKDTFSALTSGIKQIMKYKKLNLVLQQQFQFTPTGIISGFREFCRNFGLKHEIVQNLTSDIIRKGELFFVISDIDLITVLRITKENGFTLGKDLGLISFDDTPLKTILYNGITTISTDFDQMGKTAATMIIKGIYEKKENPSKLILRESM